MIIRQCDQCGTTYEAERRTSKFCSSACRVRASRNPNAYRSAKVVPLTRRPPGKAPAAGKLADTGEPRGALDVEARVRRELGASIDTAMGQACLLVARRLDDRVDASGAAVSSLVGRLEKMLDTIKASTAVAEVKADESNPITFLQQRAEERQRRGA